MKLLKVVYRNAKTPREYYYTGGDEVEVGDTVVVSMGTWEKHAIVTESFIIKPIVRVEEGE